MSIGLGLDTGGTYTDAAIVDLETGKLLYKAKSPTTREDLSIGIRGAIENVSKEYLEKISVVSLSSTLATNSVVEGKGCRVGLICIGEQYNNTVSCDFQTYIDGGHDLHGKEVKPLDEMKAIEFMNSVKGKIDGLAITGYLAVRNPDHEIRVRELAKEILDIPIVCGYELSSGLGFNERTSTAIMNARLIPIIDDLINSVKKTMTEKNIRAPLMIVRGDGTMMGEEMARTRPVETILSGPAASLVGAMVMTGLKDSIIMDIGGTTTDIGVLRNGKPHLNPEGATIGGKSTRVKAADIATSGIGGDSRIFINGREIILGSLRVLPVSFAAQKWESVKKTIYGLENQNNFRMSEAIGLDNIILDCEFFRTLRIPGPEAPLSEIDRKLLDLLLDEPLQLKKAGEIIDTHPLNFNVKKMEELGYLQRIGVTPTDILHADGQIDIYDRKASQICIGYLAQRSAQTPEEFVTKAKAMIKNKLCTELMKVLLTEEGVKDIGPDGYNLLAKSITHQDGKDFGCRIKVNKPIIGIGAPSRIYISWVGEAFDAEVVIHENSDVGNAVGAIATSVSESIEILIKPRMLGSNEAGFEVFSKLGNVAAETLEDALRRAEEQGRKYVTEEIEKDGASDVTIDVEKYEQTFGYGNSTNTALMELHMRVTAAGKPVPFA